MTEATGFPPLSYELIRTKRHTVSLSVAPDGHVTVRAPRRTPAAFIEHFVQEKRGWIEKQRALIACCPARRLVSGETLPFFGQRLLLCVSETAARVRQTGDVLTVPAGSRDEISARLTAWYRAQAKRIYPERVARCAAEVGVVPGMVRVSDAATRWGSCGKGDSINLNWRLLLAPVDVLDYVVVHELCHIGQRDHSAAFWARVARFVPDHKAKRAYLRTHRAELEL